jgi:hypothetical protein
VAPIFLNALAGFLAHFLGDFHPQASVQMPVKTEALDALKQAATEAAHDTVLSVLASAATAPHPSQGQVFVQLAAGDLARLQSVHNDATAPAPAQEPLV